MAELEITCPECGNKRGVPDDLVGKKIKCKKCQAVFTVKAPPRPAAKPAKKIEKSTAIAADPKVIPLKKEEEDDKNPYVMHEMDLSVRCPHCALPLEPQDAKICLHCGYHMQQRKRVESKQTYEITAPDYLLFHLPTFLCFLGIGLLLAFDAFCIINMTDWVEGAWFEDVFPPGCFKVWVVIVSLFPIWKASQFIFRRLSRLHPPEKEKKVSAMDEE